MAASDEGPAALSNESVRWRVLKRISSRTSTAQRWCKLRAPAEYVAPGKEQHSYISFIHAGKKLNNSYSRRLRRSFKCHFFFFNKAPEFKLCFARRLHIALLILESMAVFKVALVNLTGTSLFSSPNITAPDKTSVLSCFGAHSSWKKKMQPMDLQQITVRYKWMCNITC